MRHALVLPLLLAASCSSETSTPLVDAQVAADLCVCQDGTVPPDVPVEDRPDVVAAPADGADVAEPFDVVDAAVGDAPDALGADAATDDGGDIGATVGDAPDVVDAPDIVEADVQSANVVCAACSAGGEHTVGICVDGSCAVECLGGFANCDGDWTNGCEVGVDADPSNCGACSNRCPSRSNAVATCAEGTCGYRCNAGRGDCDGSPNNGCEVNVLASTDHCGLCRNACPLIDIHSVSTCAGGRCSFVCTSLLGDCDTNPATGCETLLNTNLNRDPCFWPGIVITQQNKAWQPSHPRVAQPAPDGRVEVP